MAYAEVAYPGDGVTKSFAVNFTLGTAPGVVTCRVNGVVRTYTINGAGQYVLTGTAPPVGSTIVFSREVSKDKLEVDWNDGAAITKAALNLSQRQIIMMAHEALDLGGRALKLPSGSVTPTDVPAPEENKFLGWRDGRLINFNSTEVIGGGVGLPIQPISKSFVGIAGINKMYDIGMAVDPGSLLVWVGGARQIPGVDYTVVGSSLMVFDNPNALSVDVWAVAGPFALNSLGGKYAQDFVQMADYGAILGSGNGTVDDSGAFAAAAASYGRVYLPAGKVYNVGTYVPTAPITGPGKIKRANVILDGLEPLVDIYRSSLLWAPTAHMDTVGQVAGGDGSVLISPGAARDLSILNRTTVVGSENLLAPVEMDRVEGFGNLVFAQSKRLDRVSAFGSIALQFFGSYEATVKATHNYWTDDPGGFKPGQVGWNVAGYETLSPGVGARIAAFADYVTPTTPIENASRTAAFGRNAFNLLVQGINNAGFGYRAGSAVYAGSGNTFLGVDAGKNNIFVNDQTAIGFEAALDWVIGDRNVLVGRGAGRQATQGVNNVIMGVYAGGDQKKLNNCVLLGARAGNGIFTDAPNLALEGALVITNDDLASGRKPLITGLFADMRVGFGGLLPNDIKGTVHIQTNPFSASPENANTAADELILENNGHAGMTIRAGDTYSSSIFFARSGLNNRGQIGYQHSTDQFTFVANGQKMRIGNGVYQLDTLPSTQPAAGSKQLWYDPADGNRVKFVP